MGGLVLLLFTSIQRDRPRGREIGVERERERERESNNQIKWVERESARIKRVSGEK